MNKKQNQGFAVKLLLMTALNIHQDVLLKDTTPIGKDRVSNRKLLSIIKLLED